jgi:hypothetical protein
MIFHYSFIEESLRQNNCLWSFLSTQYTFDYFLSKLECVGAIGIIFIEMKSN